MTSEAGEKAGAPWAPGRHGVIECCCKHWDARTCGRSRDGSDEACECACHDRDDDDGDDDEG